MTDLELRFLIVAVLVVTGVGLAIRRERQRRKTRQQALWLLAEHRRNMQAQTGREDRAGHDELECPHEDRDFCECECHG